VIYCNAVLKQGSVDGFILVRAGCSKHRLGLTIMLTLRHSRVNSWHKSTTWL